MKPSTRPALRPKAPPSKLAIASAVTSASIIQPITSLIAAALMAMTPSGARVMPKSIRMRPRIGSAVIENAVATNNADPVKLDCADSTGAERYPNASPIANGAARLKAAIRVTDVRLRFSFRCEKSNSRPIWNISRISPSCDSICIGSGGDDRKA